MTHFSEAQNAVEKPIVEKKLVWPLNGHPDSVENIEPRQRGS